MNILRQVCAVLLLAGSGFAADLPQLTVSTNVIAPPQFRSYQFTRTYKRGQTEVLRDIMEGPGENKALRMQHVIHNGEVVYSIRETREGTIVASAHGTQVSVLQIDVNRDGKPDLVVVLTGGAMDEAYQIGKDCFLLPLPTQLLFNETGGRKRQEVVVEEMRRHASQPSPAN